MLLTTKQLQNFVSKRGSKFFDKKYPIINDNMGLPSLVKMVSTDRIYGLTLSVDRNNLRRCITRDLKDMLGLTEEESNQISEFYVNEKYGEYKEIILSL